MPYSQKYDVGTEIEREFFDSTTGKMEPFSGKIVSFDKLDEGEWVYKVIYEDGDEEDLDQEEISMFAKKSKRGKRKAGKSTVDEDEMKQEPDPSIEDKELRAVSRESDSDEPFEPESASRSKSKKRKGEPFTLKKRVVQSQKRKRTVRDSRSSSLTSKRNSKKKKLVLLDSDVEIGDDADNDSDFSFTEGDGDSGDDHDLPMLTESEEEAEPEEPKRARSKPKKSNSDKKVATKSATKASSGKPKMAEMFKPMIVPSYPKLSLEEIQKNKSTLDQGGIDGGNDIINNLVSQQVDKILPLLKRTLSATGDVLGTENHPLKLGTACSGTDAPALALTMIQEQLQLRGVTDFVNTHEFSCENDPFKQAYLARNFDSVLYPDITKLTCKDESGKDVAAYIPRDVYGQEKPIPDFNLFIAGTSCKNFSMMRSKWRIDIEDKGCSGETFLAAVEILFKEKPPFAIFENVKLAPWDKMREYITGRVKLSESSSAKAIKNIGKDAKKDLEFSYSKADKTIIVESVPAVYGVRCGAILQGYTQPDSLMVKPVRWPSKGATKCTLTELIKANDISKSDDTLVFETECTYCTQTVSVDTKDFGLPQTRQRVYMFVWQPEDGNVYDDLGGYWKEIIEHLRTPAKHSMDAFMLEVDHEKIREFREALNGPSGRISKRKCFLESDFWTSASANLPHNKHTRKNLGLEDRARWFTQWGPYGQKQVPPHFWIEYLDCNFQREIDMLDILYASAFRDAEVHDPNFCSYFWNISQNASKEHHRAATPGVAGCVTPGGDFIVPHKGRPLLGCEKLLMQGIPYERLILGTETEVQLGDLAGNAMSLTVVSSTILAAITCQQLRRECSTLQKAKKLLKECHSASYKADMALVHPIDTPTESSMSNALELFKRLASLAPDAVKTSIWCTCETSGSNSRSSEFLQCRLCRVSCCRNCVNQVAGYNMSSHDTCSISISETEHNLGTFQTKLREILPHTLMISSEGWENLRSLREDLHRVASLKHRSFNLHRVKRERRKWVVVYYARDNKNIGVTQAELRLTIGELKREEVVNQELISLGMMAEITSFVPARTEPLVFGKLEPCAKFILPMKKDLDYSKEWQGNMGLSREIDVVVSGEDETASPRIEVGLKETVLDDIKKALQMNKKDFPNAKKRGEDRRWVYSNGWKTWPQRIKIKPAGTDLLDIFGSYERAACRQTTNQSALYIKKASNGRPSLYLIMRPNVSRTGPDRAIISLSGDHDDLSSIIAEFPEFWEPCDSFKSGKLSLAFREWTALPKMQCLIPESTLSVSKGSDQSNVLAKICGLSKDNVTLLSQGAQQTNPMQLNLKGGNHVQHVIRVLNSVCVAPLLQLAASGGFKYDLSPAAGWEVVEPNDSVSFGRCSKTVPIRPTEKWEFNEDAYDHERKQIGLYERNSDPGAARKYYTQLQEAPRTFEFELDTEASSITISCDPSVAAHHAAGHLIRGRGGDDFGENLTVCFKLSDVTQQSDPIVTPFVVSNCRGERNTEVKLKAPYCLYERQQKVVTKMLSIEDGQRNYEEIEMSEFDMPGAAGISLIAKATVPTQVKGGVIADAIGAGKTVISIAIILQGIARARASRAEFRKSGATIVVVPPALIDQWESEVGKFSKGLRVLKIYDFATLRLTRADAILEADIILCPVDILESDGYFKNLVKKSRVEIDSAHLPVLPHYDGQLEQRAARGLWIPATSTDPYGGGNNPRGQRRRDQSAFYTYTYQKAIVALRECYFPPHERGVPLEYFEYERIFVDEIHECLCTTKSEMKEAKEATKDSDSGFFKEKNRRAGREFLGITQRNPSLRPLVCRRAVFGLTGTPLLDSSDRVIELANLMGGVYVIGLSSHWRKLERESCRDIFLQNYLEPKQSREIRKAIFSKCQEYLKVSCCRNKAGAEMNGIKKREIRCTVKMSDEEEDLYLKSQSGITQSKRCLAIKPEDFDVSAGHDITRFLRQNSSLESRGKKLVEICQNVLKDDPKTKIVVFTDGRIGAGQAAIDALQESGLGCTWLEQSDSVAMKNKKISWYQQGDATEEDRRRPRILVLHFEHAAGLNLQTECYNLVLFCPLYVGSGGSSSDPVADASTEQQAIGRVFRAGQLRPLVNVYRIEVEGPNGEECLDGQLLRRNTDKEIISKATNAGDE